MARMAIFARNRVLEWPRFGIGKQKIRGVHAYSQRERRVPLRSIDAVCCILKISYSATGSRNMKIIFRQRVIIRTFGAINLCSFCNLLFFFFNV